jgi:molybdenum cofactor cytidylyltransferase
VIGAYEPQRPTVKGSTVGAVVLAAGASRRLGRSKARVVVPCAPTADRDTETLIHRAARLALAVVSPGPVVVVVPADDPELAESLVGLDVTMLANEEAAEGMAASIRKGIEALTDRGVDFALVLTVDQPLLAPDEVRALVSLVASPAAPAHVTLAAAAYADRVGVPAAFSKVWFDQLRALRGDQGARQLLMGAPTEALRALRLPHAEVDLDTEESVRRILADPDAVARLRAW